MRAQPATRWARSCALVLAALAVGPRSEAAPEAAPPAPVLLAQSTEGERARDVIISEDGRLMLTATEAFARVWDLRTGREVRRLPGAAFRSSSAALSQDGRHALVSGGGPETILYEVATGLEVRRYNTGGAEALAAAFVDGGSLVIVGTGVGSICLFDRDGGRRPSAVLEEHAQPVQALVVPRTGDGWWSGDSGGVVRRWGKRGRKGQEMRTSAGAALTALALSRDGELLAAGGANGGITVWKISDTREPLYVLGAGTGQIHDLCFSPDGSTLAATHSGDGTLRLWDIATAGERPRLPTLLDAPSALAYGPDGTWLAAGELSGRVRFVNLPGGEETITLKPAGKGTNAGSFSNDGRLLALLSNEGRMKVFDTSSGRPLRSVEHPNGPITRFAFAPDGIHLASGGNDGTTRLWNLYTGQEVRSYSGSLAPVGAVVFTPDGYRLVIGSEDGLVRVWDARTGERTGMRALEGHQDAITDLSISRRGDRLLSVSKDTSARVWDLRTGAPLAVIQGTELGFRGLLVHDGTQVISRVKEKALGVWNAESGKLLRRIPAAPDPAGTNTHAEPITSLALAPDGSSVLTGSWDQTARLWNAKTGKLERELVGHLADVNWTAFSPDGRVLVTGGADPTVHLWDRATGRRLSELAAFLDGGKTWCCFDAQGRWDASEPRGLMGVHWVLGLDTFDLDQLGARGFEPGLLGRHVSLAPPPDLGTAAPPRPPPSVEVQAPVPEKVLVHVEAQDQGGGLGPVVVALNGKRVNDDARVQPGRTVETRATTLSLDIDLSDDPHVLPGRTNTVAVSVYDALGTSRTRGVEVEVLAPGQALGPPHLWAIACGVSDYAGAAIDLNFACDDARAFGAALRLGAEALFGPERTHLTVLTSPAREGETLASLANLKAALEAARQCKANDVIVLYLAGHGVVGSGASADYHYLASDAQTLAFDAGGAPPAGSLAGRELSQALRALAAVKQQVVFLDTCSAGHLREVLKAGDVGTSPERALSVLHDEAGVFLLAGCAADASAYETVQFGQGLLTYALLEAMSCGCPFEAGGEVNVARLIEYACEKVPWWVRQLGMKAQQPVRSLGDTPFALGRLNPEDRAKIVLKKPKPLIVKSRFQRAKPPHQDSLSLSTLVDAALVADGKRLAAAAPAIFLDTDSMVGAYQLSGTYEVASGTATVDAFVSKLEADGEAAVVTQFRLEGACAAPADKQKLAQDLLAQALDALRSAPR